MKTTIILFALIFGYMTPTYSQLNRHRKIDRPTEQFQNKRNDDFGNYKFDDKFSGTSGYSFRTAPSKFTEEIYSGHDNMPCFQPKTGDEMPCFKPQGMFPMRVFKPKNVIWGILW